jgi:hypothetical protein
MSLLYLILVYSAKASYLRFITFFINQYWGQLKQISYQFECKYSTCYVNVMRFSDVTGYFLQDKSEHLYISDVRKIILHVVSMWDMEIPPSGGIYISHIDTNEGFS